MSTQTKMVENYYKDCIILKMYRLHWFMVGCAKNEAHDLIIITCCNEIIDVIV